MLVDTTTLHGFSVADFLHRGRGGGEGGACYERILPYQTPNQIFGEVFMYLYIHTSKYGHTPTSTWGAKDHTHPPPWKGKKHLLARGEDGGGGGGGEGAA